MHELPPLDHLVALSDGVGIIQHANAGTPDPSTGYCTDDVARAFIVALMRLEAFPDDGVARRLAGTYLAFLQGAQLEDGRFHNFMSYEREWLDDVGTHDSVGRALWAAGYGAAYAPTEQWRQACTAMLEQGARSLDWLEFPRSQAYAILGFARAYEAARAPRDAAALRALSGALAAKFAAESGAGWAWFEPEMTYDNARLPEALIRAGYALGEPQYCDVGLKALKFYESVTIEDGVFVPIGNDGWYRRGCTRARYAQQPLEAAALVDAELAALAATGDAAHLAAAQAGLAWYYGRNSRGAVMAQGGGCCDGLEADGVNRNMGAESTLAYLAAAYASAQTGKYTGKMRPLRGLSMPASKS